MITSVLICVVIFGIGYIIIMNNNEDNYTSNMDSNWSKDIEEDTEDIVKEETKETMIKIHVAGEVMNPDQLYSLPEHSRVQDAIDLAGGLTKDADLQYINLAAKIVDGQKIYIPNKEDHYDDIKDLIPDNMKISSNGLININSATKKELMELKGVGESTAEKIITYREDMGEFKSIEEIKQVSGIGESTFKDIKDSITV